MTAPVPDAADVVQEQGLEALRHERREVLVPVPDSPEVASVGGWPDPIPLGAPDPPLFPLDALPTRLARWVDGTAEAIQVPPDLVGMAVVGALSAACAGKVEVDLGRGWTERHTGLFVAIALPPGERKSEAMRRATAPLEEAEARLAEEAAPAIAEANAKRQVLEHRLAAAKRSKDEAKLEEAVLALEEHTVPDVPRLLAADVTPETLASLLAANHERMSLVSAEGGPLALMAGRYSDGHPRLEVYKHGHAGEAHRIDRRGRSEVLRSPALAVCVATQPEALARWAEVPGMRGEGLLARFWFAAPRGRVGSRDVRGVEPVPEAIRKAYALRLRRLARWRIGSPERSLLRLSEDAAEALDDFREALEPRLGPAGDLAGLADWASKLPGALARHAANLHLWNHALNLGQADTEPIAGETMRQALELAPYLEAHARIALGEAPGADPAVAKVLRRLERQGAERVTVREVFNATKGGAIPRGRGGTAVVREAFEVLEAHGYVRRTADPAKPRSEVYEVHPSLRRQDA